MNNSEVEEYGVQGEGVWNIPMQDASFLGLENAFHYRK